MIKQEVSSYWKYVFVILSIFLTITIVLNSIFRDSFYDQSLNFIKEFQSKSNFSLVVFMNLLSLLVNTNFLIAILGIIFISHKSKVASLVFLTNFLMNTYFMNILKFSYQEPRPFWYDAGVQQLEWGCPNQFGNPSGHSWMSVLMYEPLVTDFAGTGFWSLGYLFPVVAAVLVPISRMFLGAHAGNQVVMGVTIGVIMCTLYRLKFQQWLYKLYFLLDSKKNSIWGILSIAGVNLLLIVAPIIIHSVNNVHHPINQKYLDNLNNSCKKEYTSKQIQQGALQAHAIINIVFGFLFGTAASDNSNYNYFLGQWMFLSLTWPNRIIKFIFKLLLQIVISVPIPVILCFIIPQYVSMNPYLKYLSQTVGYWMFGFILTAYSNRILIKCKVIIHYKQETQIIKDTKQVSEDYLVSHSQ